MKRNRKRYILWGVVLAIVLLVVANASVYPDYFGAAVSFKWHAKTGFSEIYVFPPDAKVGLLKRSLGAIIALEARPYIGAYLKESGWEVAEGYVWVGLVPFPPVVLGIDHYAEWELIDPKVTPLMHAADRGDLDTVKALLAAGADVNARDQRHWTALMHASMSYQAGKDVVEVLLAAGADVHARDKGDITALIYAPCSRDATEKVRALLAAHAGPNVRSRDGRTPLERAVTCNVVDAAAALLAAGADPNARVLEGWTVLSIAEGGGPRTAEMVRLLKEAGARE